MGFDNRDSEPPPYQHDLSETVGKKEGRKLRARQQDRSIWYGLGMFGLIGWSIAIPALTGIAVGIWMDRTWQHRFPCTLLCLLLGVVIGCSIAWYWIKREVLDFSDPDADDSPGDRDNELNRSQEA